MATPGTLPVVVVGAGLAGLTAALALAPLPVLLLHPQAATPASAWAQGGIAAALAATDSLAAHAADTISAGAGLCDAETVARMVRAGPDAIAFLTAHGARFDRGPDGALRLGLEAAHSHRRIVHAGDATGREALRALAEAAATAPHIQTWFGTARRLVQQTGAVCGVRLEDGTMLAARAVIIATGGVGGLFADTTNPRAAWGQGLLLAACAGAVLADLEFVQFHPTALATGADPMPLISEAVRGEGAVLIDADGHRFLAGHGQAELAPRDVVARAVYARTRSGQPVFLDARAALGSGFATRFPGIAAACAEAGINPATDPIPVRPAAHYHMGGIAVDAAGRTSLPGLYACGEAAATGLHGANRLASNSLLEAVVTGLAVGQALRDAPPPKPVPTLAHAAPLPPADPAPVRPILSAALGLLRDEAGLRAAAASLLRLHDRGGPAADPALVGLMLTIAALGRRESRGAHARTDYPDRADPAARQCLTRAQILRQARALSAEAA